jgi:hypothetical protein
MRGNGGLDGVAGIEPPFLARCDVDGPQLARIRAIERVIHGLGHEEDLLPVGSPGRCVAAVRQAPDRFSCGSDEEEAPSLALRAKRDLRSVGREGGIRIVGGVVLGQVDRIPTADAQDVDVVIPGRMADVRQ